MLWQLMACAAFVLAGGILLGLPPWLFGRLEAMQMGVLCLAYLLSTVAPMAVAIRRTRWHPSLAVSSAGIVFCGAWYCAPLSGIELSLALVIQAGIVGLLLNGVLIYISHPDHSRRVVPAACTLAGLILLLAVPGLAPLRNTSLAQTEFRALGGSLSRVVDTALHRVQIHIFRARIPRPKALGGGFALAGDKLLLLTGDGLLYLLDLSTDSSRLAVQALDYTVPINSAEFLQASRGVYGSENFRVLGSLFLEGPQPQQKQLLVAHHYWHKDEACFVLRVSAALLAWPDFLAGNDTLQWQTLYETTPCLGLLSGKEGFFAGHQSGGRMVQTGPGQVLLSVGDHGFDGVKAVPAVSQNMAVAYGKTIEIDTRTGTHRVFTSGHRNPQGLQRDRTGRIWSTEHGPKGGDELNRIHPGGNYGWPLATLGADYGHFSWPLVQGLGPRQDFVEPAFAWTPSIGISSLTQIEGGEFERWQGDLLVASLIARSLYRVHLVGDQAIMAEAIMTHERLRDVVQDKQGRIIFWTDRAAIGVLTRADEED